MIFEPLIKGLIDWHLKYNKDIGGLCNEINNAKSDGIINTYTHSKSGINHTLTGAGAIMRFTATAPWIAGDTVTVNGTKLNPLNLEGQSLPAGAFVAGMQVVAIRDGQNLQFLTQSYADQFASINSQMANKANITPPQTYDLPLAEGFQYMTMTGGTWYPNIYSKNEFGQVTMRFNVARENNAGFKQNAGELLTFARLPVGYRPSCLSPFSGIIRQTGQDYRCIAINFAIRPDGMVHALMPNDMEYGVVLVGETTFIAG